MAKAFASQDDLTEKKITFDEVGCDLWAFTAEGDPNSGIIIIGDAARGMVEERGQEDWNGEFSRVLEGHKSTSGLTYPTTTFSDFMTVYWGKRRVDLMHLGRGHTADIVEDHAACDCGDGYFNEWGHTLDNIASFDVDAIAPDRGDALVGKEAVARAYDEAHGIENPSVWTAQLDHAPCALALSRDRHVGPHHEK